MFSTYSELIFIEYKGYCLRKRYFKVIKIFQKLIYNYLSNYSRIPTGDCDLIIPELKNIQNFYSDEQDIFNVDKKYFNKFNFIRISNLLNKSYFSENKIYLAKENILKIAKENAIILINRNETIKKYSGTFFIKKNGKFKIYMDINKGSEVRNIFVK